LSSLYTLYPIPYTLFVIQIFNTLSGKKELLPKTRPLRLFVCGPTVYDYPHLGHARTYINFDIIARYLKSASVPLFYLQNITDIDDKIIERARQLKTAPTKLAKRFEKAYYEDMKKLGVTSVTKYAPASKFIKEIQKQISDLIKKGYAYKTSSGVWFEIKKFKNYGELSRQNLNALRSGYRIEPDPSKKDILDFSLWKTSKARINADPNADKREPIMKLINGEPLWWSPWGWGRPGWHIEDTAITEKFFGPQYDIHGGGVDLKFPHHEAEIAQQESASGKTPLVKIWMHTGFLLVNGEKMSKSLNNFITIRNFLKTYSPLVLRFLVASLHYRSPLDYKEESAKQAEQSLMKVRGFLARLSLIKNRSVTGPNVNQWLKSVQTQFENAMEDDFNTSDALASLFWLIKQVEPKIWQLNKSEAALISKFLKEKLEIFGLSFKKPATLPASIRQLIRKRELCRTNKQFIQADALRKKINALGYILEDTPKGPLVYAQKLS
jgi:cysteinyl-tRNA synthetase